MSMERKTPERAFRDGRVDGLLGIRGNANEKALTVGDAAVLIRSTALAIMDDTLSEVSETIGADVPLTVSGTWYDGPFIPLTKGVWMVRAMAQHVRTDASGGRCAIRLMRGATVICTAQGWHPAVAGAGLHLALTVTLRVTGNVLTKLQMRTETGAATALLKAAAPYGGAEPATIITANRTRLLP